MLLVKKYEGKHWTLNTIEQRWEYHSRVVELIKFLNISSPSNVLEMGTMGVSCVDGSDTIDYMERWNFPGKKPTYIHDARVTPWPIKDKQYDLFVALRVFQHLTPFQREATIEAMRIARKVIVAVPDVYKNKELPDAKGITYMDFVGFLDGIHPNLYFPTQDEIVYYWDLENPSKINLEFVMYQNHYDTRQALALKAQDNGERIYIYKKMQDAKKIFTGKAINIIRNIKPRHIKKEGLVDQMSDSNKPVSDNVLRHIEFIGPAGIGKSTLCNEVKKYLTNNWFYREDLPDILLQDTIGDVNKNYYWLLLHGKVKNLEAQRLNVHRKIWLVRYFSNVLLKDLAMNSPDPSSKKFLLDEGLCHNFSQELMDLPDDVLKLFMAKRALIFMQARDSITIVRQIRRRERETRQKVAYHIGLNDIALKDLVESNSSLFSAFVNKVEALDVPVCKVFIEDDLHTNIKQILDFEKQLVLST